MDKTISTLEAAVADVTDDAVLIIGRFGGSGAPIDLIHALIDRYKATGRPANHGHQKQCGQQQDQHWWF